MAFSRSGSRQSPDPRDPRGPRDPFGPLPVALALAAGIALAPLLDRIGVDPWLRAAAAAAVVAAWRHRAVVLAAALGLGAARGAAPVAVAPAGVIVDDRVADRVTGVVRGPIAHGPRGDGAVLDTGDA